MSEPIIKLTERQELRRVMENEFHAVGSTQFAPAEAENYLKRLTEEQRGLLRSDRVPLNRLTAFLTFGDGFFDRPMGAYFDNLPRKDSIRPNASFALFFKQKMGNQLKIELVFYTRFFVISYYSEERKAHRDARLICRQLEGDPNNVELRQKAFNVMRRILHSDSFTPLSRKGDIRKQKPPKRFGLLLEPIIRQAPFGEFFPYILVQMKTSGVWTTPEWFKRNTIHGIYNTQGCWMLLRNYLWNTPNENAGNTFNLLTKCYLKYDPELDRIRKEIQKLELEKERKKLPPSVVAKRSKQIEVELLPILNELEKCITDCLPAQHPAQNYSPLDLWFWFSRDSRNYTYYHLIQTFVGLRYNDERNYVSYYTPSVPTAEGKMGNNCWKKTTGQKMDELFYPTEFNGKKKIAKKSLGLFCFYSSAPTILLQIREIKSLFVLFPDILHNLKTANCAD